MILNYFILCIFYFHSCSYLSGIGGFILLLLQPNKDHVVIQLGSYNCAICHTQLTA